MKPILVGLCLGLVTTAQSLAQENPLWLRNPAISPDGKEIAFTYKGDIFVVPVNGGTARQLTSNRGYDSYPFWSPNGKYIAFGSDRQGSTDIYIVDALGGTPRRVTTNSATEKPIGFLNDSTILFFSRLQPSQQAAQSGRLGQTYQVSINGGRPAMFASVPMGAMNADNKGRVLYQDKKGFEDAMRKHERSAGTSDIWLIDNNKYTKLTDFDGHDLNPIWKSDNEYWYISEKDGTLNVYCRNLDGKETQITNHKTHPVRHLSASKNGTLAYSYDGELYTIKPNGTPQKVNLKIVADNYDADQVKGYRSSGATSMAVSPDGEEVAFVLRGDVYATSVKHETTKRITNTDGQERVLSFSPDGRSIVYDSERDGMWQLFIAKIKDDKDKTFTYATDIIEEPLYRSDKPAQQPVFSPDGKKVAFLEGRDEIRVIDVDTKKVTTALDGKYNYSYSDGDIEFAWSPDSRWLLTSYIGIGGWNNSDVALAKADGTEVIDLTESGYSDGGIRWALDGKAITYTSGRYGYKSHGSWGEERDVMLMVLDPDAWDDFNLTEEEAELKKEADEDKTEENGGDKKDDKKKDKKKKDKDKNSAKEDAKVLAFDLDNRFHRTKRLTGESSALIDYWLSPKGDQLYYIARNIDGKVNLMSKDIKKGDTRTLYPSIGQGELQPDKKGDNLFLLAGDGMKKISVPGGDVESISFEAPYSRHPSAERAYIFDHAWQQVKDKFYDTNLHGVDWEMYGKEYRKFLPYINNNYDFAEMLSEMLGELNASHTGASYYGPGASQPVGILGAFFDETYAGDGLKVTEILSRGPLSSKKANIEVGDIILSIDGDTIFAGQDYFPLLEGKADKKVRLGIVKADGSTVYSTVRPVDNISPLLYQRWVERNEAIVDSISGGTIGYVHVEGMDSQSFRTVYSKLLGKYRNCDAVVVDTRYNGGGWLHNDIAILLNGKEYVRYSPRGKFIGHDPFSQWTKPSVMLVNESNYSDAHGTPYTYQTLKIGEVVGAPVPGTMTAVWWENQIDPSLLFGIPQVTSLDQDGKPLENHQLTPDIIIYNNPGDEQQGIDTQLIEATMHLMESF